MVNWVIKNIIPKLDFVDQVCSMVPVKANVITNSGPISRRVYFLKFSNNWVQIKTKNIKLLFCNFLSVKLLFKWQGKYFKRSFINGFTQIWRLFDHPSPLCHAEMTIWLRPPSLGSQKWQPPTLSLVTSFLDAPF